MSWYVSDGLTSGFVSGDLTSRGGLDGLTSRFVSNLCVCFMLWKLENTLLTIWRGIAINLDLTESQEPLVVIRDDHINITTRQSFLKG